FLNQSLSRPVLLAMRTLVLNFHPEISDTTKYGMPCYCIKTKPFCYLWTDKKTKEPYFLFVDGNLIEHPALESGNRARMKILLVNAAQDLPIKSIEEVLT
ncbi:MAG: hypothetical protein ACI898_001064, partial [Flavobacteriales bacterium]